MVNLTNVDDDVTVTLFALTLIVNEILKAQIAQLHAFSQVTVPLAHNIHGDIVPNTENVYAGAIRGPCKVNLNHDICHISMCDLLSHLEYSSLKVFMTKHIFPRPSLQSLYTMR